MISKSLSIAASLICTTTAGAQQGGFLIESTGPVTPSRPWTDLEVYAWYEPVPGVAEIFLSSTFDLVVSEGRLTRHTCAPLPITCGGTGCETTICVRQTHFPELGAFGDPTTPILVYTIRWETNDLRARTVPVATEGTSRFWVGPFEVGGGTDLYPHGFIPGAGEIVVLDSDPCYADCDLSGELDFFDFLCFQNQFAAGDVQADCDESGALDFSDFLCFQNAFAAGCS